MKLSIKLILLILNLGNPGNLIILVGMRERAGFLWNHQSR